MRITDRTEHNIDLTIEIDQFERMIRAVAAKCQPMLNKYCKQNYDDIYDLNFGGVLNRIAQYNTAPYHKYYELAQHIAILSGLVHNKILELLKDSR